MISQLFILSIRGDPIIIRNYTSDVPSGSVEAFFRYVATLSSRDLTSNVTTYVEYIYMLLTVSCLTLPNQYDTRSLIVFFLPPSHPFPWRSTVALAKQADEDPPPIHLDRGISYFHAMYGGLYFVATSTGNPPPGAVLELLYRLARAVRDFAGQLTELTVRRNFSLVYEILDEMIDAGVPQISDTAKLRPLVLQFEGVGGSLPPPPLPRRRPLPPPPAPPPPRTGVHQPLPHHPSVPTSPSYVLLPYEGPPLLFYPR